MRFIVSNDIRVIHPDKRLCNWCKEELVLDNPDFYKKEKMGKWTGNTPKNIWLYEKDGDDIILPFGCLNTLYRMFPSRDLWEIKLHDVTNLKYTSNATLYDYQEEAVKEALIKKNGILVMPCGSGKTQCGLEIIARLGLKALWLTHTQDLLNQSMNRAKGILDITGGTFGTITGGKVNVGTHITFATVQTMCKLDMEKYRDFFDIVIVDEVQRCAGTPTKVTQFYKVVSNLSARYKYGLTATPKRADGLEKSMFALIGDVIHEVSKEAVADNTCKVFVNKVKTSYIPDYDAVLLGDGTLDYNAIVTDLINNQERFNQVLDIINLLDGPTLVLANRVEYLMKLNRYSTKNSVCISALSNNKLSRAVRNSALQKLNNNEIECIFATYQLAKEGLDVPNLKYVVFATPEKDETTVIQSVGRVGRKAEGKEYGTVIDLVDDFGMYIGWSKKRDRYYKKIRAEIYEC